jgi:hypothetical protein
MTRYGVTEWRLEDERNNVCVSWTRLRATPDPRGRLARGAYWPHLPGLEPVLSGGDTLYGRGDRTGALRAFEAACAEHPEYAWAHQRVAAVAKELGRTAEAAVAARAMQRLGGS